MDENENNQNCELLASVFVMGLFLGKIATPSTDEIQETASTTEIKRLKKVEEARSPYTVVNHGFENVSSCSGGKKLLECEAGTGSGEKTGLVVGDGCIETTVPYDCLPEKAKGDFIAKLGLYPTSAVMDLVSQREEERFAARNTRRLRSRKKTKIA